ncbi:Carbon starvation protein CstA [Planctomycetales bacterium 10988]|nr:Carbon starvation protein CstA [Planctomycetales bacterium 10988]
MWQNAALVTLLSFVALGVAYLTYGRFLARRVFKLDPDRETPAHTFQDGIDYVPTKVPVLFGHHFASIAGLGPILGPAVAVYWGWLPAVLWVVIGCIFLGAVHDLGAITTSLRFQGRSIGDLCRELAGGRARLIFLIIIFFLMSLAMGAFVNAIAALFVEFRPDAIIPSFGLIVVAIGIGLSTYLLKAGLGPVTMLGLLLFGSLIVVGVNQPVPSHTWFLSDSTAEVLMAERSAEDTELIAPYGASQARAYLATLPNAEQLTTDLNEASRSAQVSWIWILLAYAFVASVLPVWLLLQPRDYLNSFQLYFALALLAGGLLLAAVMGSEVAQIQAEPIRKVVDENAPPMLPFLFVTIACGAISGFHSLVSSGTTVRQLNKETDALPIGYGAMLTEGALAILVIMACVAGLGAAAWEPAGAYGSWSGIKGGGLGVQLNAVVVGGANFLNQVGLPLIYGKAFLAVTIVAFAMTTLDSATRLLRFNVEEIGKSIGWKFLVNPYLASFLAILGIASFGLVKQAKTLFLLFGTTNQLLAGLTLFTVTLFLYRTRRPILYTLIPTLFMLVVTTVAMGYTFLDQWATEADQKPWLLIIVSVVVFLMTVWLIIEGIMAFAKGPEPIEETAASSEPSQVEETVEVE